MNLCTSPAISPERTVAREQATQEIPPSARRCSPPTSPTASPA
ncbi:MAG: hypothetical protein QFX32_05550 [Methanolinea sp.]|nr:hypothetical protein [Methanolinea sp.]